MMQSRTRFGILPNYEAINQKPDRKNLSELNPYIIPCIAIIGIGVSAGIAIYNRCKNRVQSEKDKFGVFIREQTAKLPPANIEHFYRTTKPDMKVAVERLKHFLNTNDRNRIDRLWREYDETPYENFQKERESETMRAIENMDGFSCHNPRDIVKYYLDGFYKFAS